MKKLLHIISVAVLVAVCSSCSNPTKPEEEPWQEYTSFVFWHNEDLITPNCVVGYFDEDGFCWKIAELGDLSKGQHSEEVVVSDENIEVVYLFSDYIRPMMFQNPYTLKKNTKNIFLISGGGMDVLDKTDPMKYPQ